MARLFIITKHATRDTAVLFKQQRLKTGGQYSKVLRIPLNQALMPYTCPDVDWALLNFRLFLKLGPLVGLGPRASCPSASPPPLGGPHYECLYMVTFFSCQFCVFQSSFDTWLTQQSYLLFLFQANLKNTCKVLLGN